MLNENTKVVLQDKWSPILECIEDSHVRESTAVLLENQARAIMTETSRDQLNEDTAVGNLGMFQKFAFPIVRRVFPELIANKIVGVQPMQGPVSQIFYLGYDRAVDSNARKESVYGKYLMTPFGLTASGHGGSHASKLHAGGLFGPTSGLDEYMHSQDIGVPAVTMFSALSGLDGGVGSMSSTIGSHIASFPSANSLGGWSTRIGETLGSATTGRQIPEINFHIEQQAVAAGTRKFRALWTIEAAQDLRAYHNLDLERELTELLSKEVQLEIDREILENLRMIAYDVDAFHYWERSKNDLGNPNSFPAVAGFQDGTQASTDFTYNFGATTNPAGTDKNVFFVDLNSSSLNLQPRHVGEAYANLVAAINFAAQDIYKSTLRGAGNYILTSPMVAAMLHSSSKLEGGMGSEETGQLGNSLQYKGKWMGMYDVFVDPLWPDDEILVGYKGNSPMDAGFVYAPYIPLQMLPTVVDPNSFQPRKGLLTRYGKAAITPESRFYRIIRLVGATSRYMLAPFARIDEAWDTVTSDSHYLQ